MIESRTEQQLETLETWWETNGKRVLAAGITLIALVAGWSQWSGWQQQRTQEASAHYQDMLDILQEDDDAAYLPQGAARDTVLQLAEILREEHSRSIYAQYGSLLEAKQAVEEGDLQRAQDVLQWVLVQEPDQVINAITHLRLARVAWARGDQQNAQQYLLSPEPGYFLPPFQEKRGDMLWDFGLHDQALQAYTMAAGSYDKDLPERLRYKIQETASLTASKGAGAAGAAAAVEAAAVKATARTVDTYIGTAADSDEPAP